MALHLYSTLGCHLCEKAAVVLLPLTSELGLALIEVDIANSDQLIDRYGTRIPVLLNTETREELNWPFSREDIEAFLAVSPTS